MSILTQSGRAAIAASIKKQAIHLAWGTGDPSWESQHKLERTLVKGELVLDHQPVKNLTLTHQQTTYQPSVDYVVDSRTGVIKRLEKGALADNSSVTVAYTQGTPPEHMAAAKLRKEVGRRVADEVLFCMGDQDGELITPTGRFKAATEPTNNLYLKFTFDFHDAADQVIRELGVMVGTQVQPDLPPGQRYFEPSSITDPGILLVLEHTVPLIRTAATRETFTFVITF